MPRPDGIGRPGTVDPLVPPDLDLDLQLDLDDPFDDEDGDDLLDDLRAAMASGRPLDLLAHASGMLDAVDPRNDDPFSRRPDPGPDDDAELGRAEMVELLSLAGRPETNALVAAIGTLSDDEDERRRIERHLRRPRRPARGLPAWLDGMDRATVERAARITEELGDEEDVVLGVRLATGEALTAVVHIDNNAGSIVYDGFVAEGPVEDIATAVETTGPPADGPGPTLTWADVDPAEARARITAAVTWGARTIPPALTHSWPAARPLVEWICRQAPDGFALPERREWSDPERAALADRFLASPMAADLDDDAPGLVESLLWFGCDYGPGDPLRWSPQSVEDLLLGWVPRKIVEDRAVLAKVPAVLRAFVAFAHAETGVRPVLTDATLDAIAACEPEYRRAIADEGRPMGPNALLAALGLVDPDGSFGADREDELARVVGGREALDDLDDRPLPDEPFAWDLVPIGAQDRTGEVLALCDEACDALYDVEVRTACRRLLARLAGERPDLLTGRGKAATAAWAVCWIVGTANDVFSSWTPCQQGQVKDLTAHLGLGQAANTRATTFLKALGIDHDPWRSRILALGTPDLLTSCRRRQILHLRHLT